VASFVGFVPASRPALVVLVSLDTPRGARNQGGDVAAPLFARVAEHALRQRGVPPDDPQRTLHFAAYTAPAATVMPAAWRPGAPNLASPQTALPPGAAPAAPAPSGSMPDLRGLSAREAAVAATRAGLIVELEGSGKVLEQAPEPGTQIEPGRACRLRLAHTGSEALAAGSTPGASGPAGEVR
jgi:hypothetical protein